MRISLFVLASIMMTFCIHANAQHEFVDLGLSVKWATCNVGATKPEEYGDYYAWGETEPKSEYTISSYKYSKGSVGTLTKYCTECEYVLGYNGFIDNKIVLDPEDDAAHVKWGGKWRMPTIDEWKELVNNCNWIWTIQNGINGYVITSNKEGYTDYSIFLPAADIKATRNGITFDEPGSGVEYNSSSLDVGSPEFALGYGRDNMTGRFAEIHMGRYIGCPVRPVCK